MDLSSLLAIISLAASPISELRGAIPVAISVYDYPWWQAYLIGVAGNILPVPFILLLLEFITGLLSRWTIFDRFFQWIFRVVRRRGEKVSRWHYVGLILFVAIPLPVTGAWTASILSVLSKFSFWPAFFSIVAGILLAGVIVTVAWSAGWHLAGLIGV